MSQEVLEGNRTAMQHFISVMEETMSDNRCDIIIARSIKAHINLAKGLLEKEKRQIIEAYDFGWGNGHFSYESGETVKGETFFEKTYNQTQKR